MKKFWELLEKSVIVQSAVTFLMTVALVVMWTAPLWSARTVDIPPEAYAIIGTVYGYWFGVKQSFVQSKDVITKANAFDKLARKLGFYDPEDSTT